MANNKIREEEVKNRIRQEFFQDYDATPIARSSDIRWLFIHSNRPLGVFSRSIRCTGCRKRVVALLSQTSKSQP